MRKVEQAKAGQDARYTQVVVCTPDISINNQPVSQPTTTTIALTVVSSCFD